MDEYTLILGDCLDKMGQIEDGSVDAIICDLPYGTTACKWDTIIPFEPLWAHYKRVIKRRGAVVLFGTFPFTALLWASNPSWFKYDLTWRKNKGTGHLNAKKMPMRAHESILVFGNNSIAYNPQMRQGKPYQRINCSKAALNKGTFGATRESYSTVNTTGNRYPLSVLDFDVVEITLHPTQKPVALLEYLIRTYTNPGELVLDNTFGSCSTGEACLRMGRRFIGIEKDPGYFEIGRARMERVAAELRGEFVSKPTNGKVEDLPMFAGIA